MGYKLNAFGFAFVAFALNGSSALAAVDSPLFPAKPTAVSNPNLEALQTRIYKALDKIRGRDFKGARADFLKVVESPDFPLLATKSQYNVLKLLAVAEEQLGQNEDAYTHLMQAGAVAPEARDGDFWLLVYILGAKTQRYEPVIEAMTYMAKDFPEYLPSLEAKQLYGLNRRSQNFSDSGELRLQWLRALKSADYRSKDTFLTLEWLWFDLFELEVAKGNNDRSRELLSQLTESSLVISVRSDNRYRGFLSSLPQHGDYLAAQEESINKFRLLMASNPRKLEAVVFLADRLLRANRLDEALNLIDTSLAKVEQAPRKTPAFEDVDKQLNWALDMRSRILSKQGRWDEVEKAMVKARDFAQSRGNDMVSQAINLGGFYNWQGRPKEALNAVKDADKRSSPYGVMSATEVKVCAYAQLKDKVNLTKALDYMRAHAADGYSPYQTALLCAGELDTLATLFIARLDDPQKRNDMLVDLQIYLPSPQATTLDKIMDANYEAVIARPDMQAAIAKYGVREAYPIFSGGY